MSANGRFPKIKFRSSAMDSVMAESDESDGQDDSEFLEEREKYLKQCEARAVEALKQEEERLNVYYLSQNPPANVM